MKLTARYGFSASHRLHSDQLSEQKNWDVFGRCNNPYGHGHNYSLEVTVSGEPDPTTGLLVDRAQLDRYVEESVVQHVRHRDLNQELPQLGGLVPTTENVAYVFTAMLKQRWSEYFSSSKLALDRIRIYETRNNLFEIQANEVQH